jgi:hypothetical protein
MVRTWLLRPVMRFAVAAVFGVQLLLSGCFGNISDGGDDGPGAKADGGVKQPDAQTIDYKAIFKTWSGCMTLANFQAANMATAWSTLTTSDNKQCLNCHDQGQYDFIATDDEAAYFTKLSQHSYFLAKYFTVDPATMKVIVSTASFKSANSKTGHPKFNAEANQGITALTTFHASTAANTACGAPTMID